MNSFGQDEQARDAITSNKEKDIDTNFFVEASAGSGKTTSLVSRMVNMVKDGREGRDVDKICAITFTKAAANEFYSRFREALAKEKDNERCKEALKNIDLAFMGTIDAFCQRILSEHPVEAGLPASFEHIDIDEQSLELKKALVNINTDSNHPLHDKYVSLRSLFRFTDVDTLILNGSLLMYWERRDAFLMTPDVSEDAFDEVVRDVKALSDELRSIPKSNREETTKGSKAAWNAVYRLLRIKDWDNVDIGHLLAVLNDLAKSKNGYSDLRINPDPGLTLNSFYFERMKSGKRWQPASNPFETCKEKLQKHIYKDLLEFIESFVHMESEELKKRGRLTYFDAKMALRDMLKADIEKNSSHLIKHIQQVHKYYLVDEFQDTDPMQAEILFYLTADEPKANWRECKPAKGTLFIVGDPKQSIYRFRGADIASFRDVKNLFLNGAGKVETLTCNFRSSDKLCSEFNDIFSVLLEKHKDNSGSYDLTIPVNAGAGDEKNMKVPNGSTMDGIYKYNPGECKNDPEEVRKIVSSIVHNPAFQIQDYLSYSKEGVTPVTREVEYRDIMIITSKKDPLLLYMDEFKKADIPYVVEGAVMFGASFALRLTYYFMSYFASPSDKGAIYGIKTIGGIDIENEEIKELQKRAGSLSPSALFSAVISLKTFEEHADTENFEYLYYALEILRSKEVSGEIVSLQDALSFLESLILGDSDNERCLQLERDNNAVKLANLHKVKGLEAPVVILAYPNCTIEPNADVRFERTENGGKCFIFDIKKDKGPTRSKPFWDNEERKSEVVSIYAERIRGLYVAATRARNILFVSSCGKNGEVWKELADLVDEKFDIDSVDISSISDYGDTSSGEYKKLELTDAVREKSYSIQKPSDGHKAVKLADEDSVEDGTAEADSDFGRAAGNDGSDSDASLRGTMVHRLMEIIVRRKGKSVSDGMLDYIVSEYVQSDENGKYKLMLKNVRDTLFAGGFDQKDGAPKDFISEIRASEEAHAEVPFCYRDGSSVVNGVVDCLYKKKKDKDGKEGYEWHIIDFKTNRDGNGLAEYYSGQLECYKEAFRTLVRGENIADSLIYHIDISGK